MEVEEDKEQMKAADTSEELEELLQSVNSVIKFFVFEAGEKKFATLGVISPFDSGFTASLLVL